jgi:hypothetical protein
MKHPGVVRNLESTLLELLARGHRLELAFESVKTEESRNLVRRLVAAGDGAVEIVSPPRADGPYADLAGILRRGIDYLRYLEPRYAEAEKLRARARGQAPRSVRILAALPLLRSARGVTALRRALQAVERRLPPPPAVTTFVRERRPDAVLVTPLVGIGSAQADYLRAARQLGVPSGFPVLSWDNLTNKGLLRDTPDLVLVWNELQRSEAVELHDVPAERVVVTGAPGYDHWFSWSPSRTREAFCEEVGLRSDRPLVVYVCSSPFIAPRETAFVERWLGSLRAAGGSLADVGVLVRPHPQNAAQWEDFAAPEQVVVWPPRGQDPLDDDARRNYFDSLALCAAVVGLNTSALIESAIVGRPVLTLVDPEFSGTQEGTLHFRHLSRPDFGPLFVARDPEGHVAQLRAALDGTLDAEARNNRFVAEFVRPNGLERSATEAAVAAIESLAGVIPPGGIPAGAEVVRTVARWPAGAASALERRRARASRARKRADLGVAAEVEARRELARLAAADGPIVAGPWVAEVGYELLYWIPFLRWAAAVEPALEGRLTALSRGGVASWYADVCGEYVDLLDRLSPDELRAVVEEDEERAGLRKQMRATAGDRRLLERAGLATAAVLHPETMFAAHRALLKQRAYTRPGGLFPLAPIGVPDLPEVASRLPEDYVAVRFYANVAFPDTVANRHVAAEAVAALADEGPVVLLDPGVRVDDHWDIGLEDDRLIRIGDLSTPSTNLAVQTAVVARARAFVGTYGGLSYLPSLAGVPSFALYSDPERFRRHHLDRAVALLADPPFGRYAALDVRAADLRALAVPRPRSPLRG